MKQYIEDIIICKNPAEGRILQLACKKGKVQRLARGIYSGNLQDTSEVLVKRHLFHILGHLFQGAVISHRSAIEGGVSKDGIIVLTYRYTRNIKLPGVLVKLVQGPGPLKSDTVFLDSLFISSRARALLENLQPSRSRVLASKTLALSDLELWLDKLARVYGQAELNRIRDDAKTIASELGWQSELIRLEKCVASILGTGPANNLVNKATQARASQQTPATPITPPTTETALWNHR